MSVETQTTKRCEERENMYDESRKLELDNSTGFELLALISMVLSVSGVFMDWKWSAWISLLVAFKNITNYEVGKELKQIFSSLFVCTSAVALLYNKNPTPIGEGFFG